MCGWYTYDRVNFSLHYGKKKRRERERGGEGRGELLTTEVS